MAAAHTTVLQLCHEHVRVRLSVVAFKLAERALLAAKPDNRHARHRYTRTNGHRGTRESTRINDTSCKTH